MMNNIRLRNDHLLELVLACKPLAHRMLFCKTGTRPVCDNKCDILSSVVECEESGFFQRINELDVQSSGVLH